MLVSDSYSESLEDELPRESSDPGEYSDHCDDSSWNDVGEGEAGGEGGRAIFAQSMASTYA